MVTEIIVVISKTSKQSSYSQELLFASALSSIVPQDVWDSKRMNHSKSTNFRYQHELLPLSQWTTFLAVHIIESGFVFVYPCDVCQFLDFVTLMRTWPLFMLNCTLFGDLTNHSYSIRTTMFLSTLFWKVGIIFKWVSSAKPQRLPTSLAPFAKKIGKTDSTINIGKQRSRGMLHTGQCCTLIECENQ